MMYSMIAVSVKHELKGHSTSSSEMYHLHVLLQVIKADGTRVARLSVAFSGASGTSDWAE
jgi:hypothetical protein